jgi:hypothetical protein
MPRMLAAGLCLALVAASGCGGSGSGTGKKEATRYTEAVNKVQTDFAASLTNAESKRTTNSKAASRQLEAVKTALDKAVADLKAVKPPDKVAKLHNDLVAEMTQLDKGIGDAATALSAGNAKTLQQAQSKLSSELGNLGTRVQATIAAINRKLRS